MAEYEYHNIVRHLVAMMANQDTIHTDLRTATQRIDHASDRVAAAIEGLALTQARIEALLARLESPG